MKNRLEELRRERGITQEELAAILEVSRQTISSIETGQFNPTAKAGCSFWRGCSCWPGPGCC